MNGFKRVLIAVLGTAALTTNLPAAAVPVAPGSPVVFNFSSAIPGPFSTYALYFGVSECSVFEDYAYIGCHGTDAPDAGTITLFDGLDGAGANGGAIGSWSDSALSVSRGGSTSSLPAVADGIFSLVYAASIGQIDVVAPYITLTNARGTVRVDGVGPSAVPEPEPIALLGIGSLAAIGVARRTRRMRPVAA